MNKSIKKVVRSRDQQRCSECGMTAEEHRRRFGRTLHVHRTRYKGARSLGPYEAATCIAICQLCHQAKHSLKCAVRKRDGYACTECGMTDAEHHRLYGQPLPVHAQRCAECNEREWEMLGIKADECRTLCRLCHEGKHSIRPAVVRRDGFQCIDCGKTPDDERLWFEILCVHRLQGYCQHNIGLDASAADFVTLCFDCHERKHPDRFAEYTAYGMKLDLPEVMRKFPEDFGVARRVTRREELSMYKEYLLLVNRFIDHFRRHGVPKEIEPTDALRALANFGLSRPLCFEAAKEAAKALTWRFGLSRKEERDFKRVTDMEKETLLKRLDDRRLDSIMKHNAEPTVTFLTDEGFARASI